MTDDAFVKTLEQETAKQAAMLNGDPGLMINYWADSDADCRGTKFGPALTHRFRAARIIGWYLRASMTSSWRVEARLAR